MCGTTTVYITISATKANPFPPTISDGSHSANTGPGDTAFVTSVKPGNRVVFQKAGDISSITAITDISGNVFSTDPTLQGDGTWLGVIGNYPVSTEETYSITYRLQGKTYTQDPKLQINP